MGVTRFRQGLQTMKQRAGAPKASLTMGNAFNWQPELRSRGLIAMSTAQSLAFWL